MAKTNKFTMGGNNKKMDAMMKQAQKMQEEMEKVQAEVEAKEIETSAGGGAVTVKMKGSKEITSIKINPEIINADDIEMLEDLIIVAVNDAIKQTSDMLEDGMGSITGGLNIPGLF